MDVDTLLVVMTIESTTQILILSILTQMHQMTLKQRWTAQGQRFPHISFTGVHESQIQIRFDLEPVVLEELGILGQVHRVTPK